MWVFYVLHSTFHFILPVFFSKRRFEIGIDLLSGVDNISVLINFERELFHANQRDWERERGRSWDSEWDPCGRRAASHELSTSRSNKFISGPPFSSLLQRNIHTYISWGPKPFIVTVYLYFATPMRAQENNAIVYRIIENLFYKLNFNSNVIDFVYLLNWFRTHVQKRRINEAKERTRERLSRGKKNEYRSEIKKTTFMHIDKQTKWK